MFQDPELLVTLRLFQCARVDLGKDAAASEAFGKRAPLFVAFDATGAQVDLESFRGFKAKARSLVKVLEKAAARGRRKVLAPGKFTKEYRDILRGLIGCGGCGARYRRPSQTRGSKGNKPKDLAELAKDTAEIEERKHELLVQETKLLESAAVPPRPAGAERLGGPGLGSSGWGRRDRGGRDRGAGGGGRARGGE